MPKTKDWKQPCLRYRVSQRRLGNGWKRMQKMWVAESFIKSEELRAKKVKTKTLCTVCYMRKKNFLQSFVMD